MKDFLHMQQDRFKIRWIKNAACQETQQKQLELRNAIIHAEILRIKLDMSPAEFDQCRTDLGKDPTLPNYHIMSGEQKADAAASHRSRTRSLGKESIA